MSRRKSKPGPHPAPLSRPAREPGRYRYAWVTAWCAILLAAAGIRLWNLGAASLWFDEALTVDIALHPLADIPAEVRAREQIPPLYHLFMHVWVDRVGDGDAAARLPSVLFGVAAVAVLMALARQLFGRCEAIAAGVLAALSGFWIEYAQEARPYTLLTLTALASCLAFARLMKTSGRKEGVAYVLATAALLWNHLFGAFIILAQLVAWAIAYGTRRAEGLACPSLRRYAFLSAIALLLFAPWIPTVIRWLDQVTTSFWIPPVSMKTAWDAYVTYAGGAAPLVLLAALACVGAAKSKERWKPMFLFGLWVFPVLLPIVVSLLRRPVFVPRYGIVAAAGLWLLAARGWASLPGTAWKSTVAVLLLGLASYDALTSPARAAADKPDWRAATAYVLANDRPGDAVLINADFNNLVFQHYALRHSDAVDASYVVDSRGAAATALDLPPDARRLWLVTLPDRLGGYHVYSKVDVEQHGWGAREGRSFPVGIRVTLFERP